MERFKNQTFQTKLLVVLLFLLLNVALIGLVGVPGIQSVDDVAVSHNEKLMRIELMLASEKAIEEKEANIEELKGHLAGFEKQVPDNIDYAQVIHDFYAYSVNRSVTPIYLSFSDTTMYEVPAAEGENLVKPADDESETISTLTLNFSATGTPDEIVLFLEELSQISPLALTVKDLMIYDTGDGKLGVELNFIQYVRGHNDSDIPYAEYTFYNDSIGFNDIASLFRTDPTLVMEPGTSAEALEVETQP